MTWWQIALMANGVASTIWAGWVTRRLQRMRAELTHLKDQQWELACFFGRAVGELERKKVH